MEIGKALAIRLIELEFAVDPGFILTHTVNKIVEELTATSPLDLKLRVFVDDSVQAIVIDGCF